MTIIGYIVAVLIVICGILILDHSFGKTKEDILFSIWHLACQKCRNENFVGIPVSIHEIVDSSNVTSQEAYRTVRKLSKEGILSLVETKVKFTTYGKWFFETNYKRKARY
jgi:predicted methyltransferase